MSASFHDFLTGQPTLAAAQDAVNSGLYTAPAGFTNEQVLTNIGAGYALTYLFGLIGLIIIIRVLPKILHIDLPAEAAKMQGDRSITAPLKQPALPWSVLHPLAHAASFLPPPPLCRTGSYPRVAQHSWSLVSSSAVLPVGHYRGAN
jgi:hypothetical protein